MKIAGATLLFAFGAAAAAGPISKFDERSALEYRSAASVDTIERCLIDLPAMTAPFVYKQADRPGQATIIWTGPYGQAGVRVDLRQDSAGTKVKAWALAKQVEQCAPRATTISAPPSKP